MRGVVYDSSETVGVQNVHPFCFEGASFALAQNGDLYDFGLMRYDLVDRIDPQLLRRIEGTTDTEWVYALILSQLPDPFARIAPSDAARAVSTALEILREARDARGLTTQSPVNLVLTDGSWMLATRYAFDYGWYRRTARSSPASASTTSRRSGTRSVARSAAVTTAPSAWRPGVSARSSSPASP